MNFNFKDLPSFINFKWYGSLAETMRARQKSINAKGKNSELECHFEYRLDDSTKWNSLISASKQTVISGQYIDDWYDWQDLRNNDIAGHIVQFRFRIAGTVSQVENASSIGLYVDDLAIWSVEEITSKPRIFL